MSTLPRLLKTGVCGLLLLGLALPALASNDTPYLNQSAIEMIENSVARLVINDAIELYGLDVASTCFQTDQLAACIDPNTPPERVAEILRSLPTYIEAGGDRYDRVGRWTTTASGYFGILGDPIILSYSFIPDGTYIPPGTGEPGSNSVLFATLNSQFGGDTEAWKQIFRENFARWASTTGITYIEEANDDGATWRTSPGILGTRGDVRIGAHPIDGSSGTLAYNYFPNYGGDMVLDSSENWTQGSDYRFLRNVVMHEHGHGHGLGHVVTSNNTLMEPFYSSAFLGPQDDDIRGGNRNYGDYLEKNGSAAEASEWGLLGEGLFEQLNVSLTSSADKDWFKFTIASGMEIDFYMTPVGSYYILDNTGDDGINNGAPIFTNQIMDLSFNLYDGDGTTILETVNNGGLGVQESLLNYSLDPGDYYIRIARVSGNDTQRYRFQMDLTLNDLTAVGDGDVPVRGMGLSVYPTPFNPKTTARFYVAGAGNVNLQVFNVQGRVVRQFTEEASGAGWMQIDWNGRDDRGASVPSGLYFLRADSASGRSETVRALLLK